jgi:hypothetical protein
LEDSVFKTMEDKILMVLLMVLSIIITLKLLILIHIVEIIHLLLKKPIEEHLLQVMLNSMIKNNHYKHIMGIKLIKRLRRDFIKNLCPKWIKLFNNQNIVKINWKNIQ